MKTKINKTRLRGLIAFHAEQPKRLDMGQWGVQSIPNVKYSKDGVRAKLRSIGDIHAKDLAPCGTAVCAAGTAVLLYAKGKDRKNAIKTETIDISDSNINRFTKVKRFTDKTSVIATKLLGLDIEQASILFHVKKWPEPERAMYQSTIANPYGTSEEVAARRFAAFKQLIKRFIAVDGDVEQLFYY